MNWKEFLKPDWRKIAIFVALFIISNLAMFVSNLRNIGFPLEYFYPEIIDPGFSKPVYDFKTLTNLLNLLIDVIFWYLLSCLIIWIYDKRKKK